MEKQIISRLYIGKNVQGVPTLSTQTIVGVVYAETGLDFTVYETVGFWKGEKEKSVMIEAIADTVVFTKPQIEKIKDILNQDAILLTIQEINSELV